MNIIQLTFGDVRKKSIITPNHFVSHMIEHIAWRLGLEIRLVWDNQDWFLLGKRLGQKISEFPARQKLAAALGMIDDGSAEVSINSSKKGLKLSAIKSIDLKWFLSVRCEQLSSGKPLVNLLEGLAQGLGVKIAIRICSFEDPHHTWEGLFRGVGIALNKIYAPKIETQPFLGVSLNQAAIKRVTAETVILVKVDFKSEQKNKISIAVDKSVNIKGLNKLLELLTSQAGFNLNVDFQARALSSSHVVMEDIGLVLGRALLKVLKQRMKKYGVNGAGSNVELPRDLTNNKLNVGVSVEGRKFWRFVPFDGNVATFKRKFLIGQNVLDNLRSEDLDDFVDGLAGGLGASIMIGLNDCQHPNLIWQEIFVCLGKALKQTLEINHFRRGVPPGVKATLI